MTNGELAKELSQYPLTAIATGLLDFERFNKKLSKSDDDSVNWVAPHPIGGQKHHFRIEHHYAQQVEMRLMVCDDN